MIDIDEVWLKIREHITNEVVLLDIAQTLLRDADRHGLFMAGYRIIYDLMEIDDDEYVFARGFNTYSDKKIDEELAFEIKHNALKKKRAKKIMKRAQFWRG